jgi:hypothetical protein
MLAGLLLSNSLLGAATTLGGINAAICLGGLLSAAGGDELRSSILLLAADGVGNKLRSSSCCSLVCLPPLKIIASCLLLLNPTAMCLGFGHYEH